MSLTAHSPGYTDEPIYRLTVDQYHELIRSGKLTDEDPVELIDGILFYKMPKKTPHTTCAMLARREVERRLPPGWHYRSQDPITLSDGEPEPDGAVVRGRIEDYALAHPGPESVFLVIEVADATIGRDRGIKLRSYARAGIPIYWILDLTTHALDVFSEPEPSAGPAATYRNHVRLMPDEGVALTLDGRSLGEIRVSAMLPQQQA